MNNLYITADIGETMGHHRVDQDYSDAGSIAADLVAKYRPGATSYEWAIGDVEGIKRHCKSKNADPTKIKVAKRRDTPPGASLFAREGRAVVDVAETEAIVYMPSANP